MRITWRSILVWYAAMVGLCFVGTFLAYQGPLSSDAWQGWDGADAWKRDLMRAVVSAVLSVFVLWSMDVAPHKGQGSSISGEKVGLQPYEKRLFAAIFLMLVLMIFFILPEAFKAGWTPEARPWPALSSRS